MKKKNVRNTSILLAAAIALLAFSGVGSTRAALNAYSDTYRVAASVSNIGITLNENGVAVGERDYQGDAKNNRGWYEGKDLSHELLGSVDQIVPGMKYDEALTVTNSGDIPTYVKVEVNRYWSDADGNKVTTLNPELIQLNYLESNGWIKGEETAESVTYYYSKPVSVNGTTAALSDKLTLDPAINGKVEATADADGIVTLTYVYDGYQINLTADAYAVQCSSDDSVNVAAIASAWGVDAKMAGGTIVSVK